MIFDISVFTAEQYEEIEKMAAMNFSIDEMALYFDMDTVAFRAAAEAKDSPINYHVRRGKLISEAQMQMSLLDSAKAGNITAITEINKIRRDRGFESSKLDIFGAFDKEDTLDKIRDYMLSGDRKALEGDEAIYMDVLLMIVSLNRQIGKRATVKMLTNDPFGCTYAKASDLYDQAINMFYADRNTTKKALRNKYAEMLDDMALQARNTAKTAKDMEIAANITVQAAKMRELHKDDPVVLSPDVYAKKVRIYSLDASVVGGGVNRLEVAQIIDGLNLPENAKYRLKRDACVDDIDVLFEDLVNESQEESNAE